MIMIMTLIILNKPQRQASPGVGVCFLLKIVGKSHIVVTESIWPLAHLKCRKKSLGTIFKISFQERAIQKQMKTKKNLMLSMVNLRHI